MLKSLWFTLVIALSATSVMAAETVKTAEMTATTAINTQAIPHASTQAITQDSTGGTGASSVGTGVNSGTTTTPPAGIPKDAVACDVGGRIMILANTKWHFYACNDNRTAVIVTAADNPANPFFFMFHFEETGMRLMGQGTGDKAVTQAVFKELSTYSVPQVRALMAEVYADHTPNR